MTLGICLTRRSSPAKRAGAYTPFILHAIPRTRRLAPTLWNLPQGRGLSDEAGATMRTTLAHMFVAGGAEPLYSADEMYASADQLINQHGWLEKTVVPDEGTLDALFRDFVAERKADVSFAPAEGLSDGVPGVVAIRVSEVAASQGVSTAASFWSSGKLAGNQTWSMRCRTWRSTQRPCELRGRRPCSACGCPPSWIPKLDTT